MVFRSNRQTRRAKAQKVPGIQGPSGSHGRDGHDGTGLTLKTFVKGKTYHHGDYVFAPSSKDPNHDSMYIAEATFTALEVPSKELDRKHWVEFEAPQGEAGEKGDKGITGPGNDEEINVVKKDVNAKMEKMEEELEEMRKFMRSKFTALER